MSQDKSFRLPYAAVKAAPVEDHFSVLPSTYGDALGDAEAQLCAVMARLSLLEAQLKASGGAADALRNASRQEVAEIRDRLRQQLKTWVDDHTTSPQLQQLEDQLSDNAAASAAGLREELAQLLEVGGRLGELQRGASRQAAQRSGDVAAGALRRAAQQLELSPNATRLQAHGEGDDEEAARRDAPGIGDLKLSQGQQKAVERMARRVSSEVSGDPAGLPAAKVQRLQGDYGDMLHAMQEAGGARLQDLDTEALIQRVMYDAYKASSDDLRTYALRVDFYSEIKNALRDELAKARKYLSDNGGAKDLTAPYARRRFSSLALVTPNGSLKMREPQADGEARDAKQLEDYIKDLENQLSTLGEDTQLAQLKLQTMVQRQQQLLQQLSNLAKVFHETHMSIIRKLGN